MDSENLSNLIAGLALAISVVVFIRGEMTRHKGAEQAKTADAAAEKSAEAAERSAAALERMAEQWGDSLSRQEQRDRRQWTGRPSGGPSGEVRGGPWAGPMAEGNPEPVVHWTVDKVEGRQHTLENLGRSTAYSVELRCENAVRFDGPEVRDIQMGESVEFLAIGSMQSGTPELVVSWMDSPNGERREWRRPLP